MAHRLDFENVFVLDFLDTLRLGLIVFDLRTGNLIRANTYIANLLGYPLYEFADLKVTELIADFQELLDIKDSEYMFIKKDKTLLNVQVSMGVISLYGEECHYLIVNDITKFKTAEKFLNDKVIFLERVSDAVPNPVFYKDSNGTYKGCNKAFEEYIGLPRERIVGSSVFDIAPKNLAETYFQKDMELFINPGIQNYESRVVYADGSLHDVIFNKATVLNEDREVIGLVGVINDISERKRAEEALIQSEQIFKAIFNNAAIGITLSDTDGKPIICNPALLQMLGYSNDEVTKMSFADFTHPEDIESNLNLLQELIEGKRDSYQMEKRYIKKNGHAFWAQLTVSRIIGSLTNHKLIAIIEDISARKEIENSLSVSEIKYRTVFETTGTATIILEEDMKISLANTKFAEIVGYSKIEIEGKYWQEFCSKGFLAKTQKYHYNRRINPENVPSSYECQIINKDQKAIYVLLTVSIIPGTQKSVVSCMDLTEVKEGEKILRRYQLLSEHARDIILFINNFGEIIEANDAATKAYGYQRNELLNMRVHQLLPHGSEPLIPDRIEKYTDQAKLFEFIHCHKGGNCFPVEMSIQGTWVGNQYIYLAVVRDITERKRVEEQLRHLATHDFLTNIANRYLLEDTLQRIIDKAQRGQKSALLLIDLDNFKLINDTRGHSVGDQVLVSLVDIIRSNIRKGDFLARLGGDEFAILLDTIDEEAALNVANKIRTVVDGSGLCLQEYKTCFNLTISVGVVMIDGSLNAPRLISNADIALYKAKETGRNRVVLFNSNHLAEYTLSDVNIVINEIKDAIRENRLFLMFQPIYSVSDKIIIHHEALVRMKGTSGNVIPPNMFIPTAEKFGLMPKIDQWVVETSIKYLQDNPALKLFVNISGISLSNEELLLSIENSIKESRIDPKNLGFEITETAAVKDFAQSERWIKKLQSMGCKFALDDFGRGFASFSYLRYVPVDYIKIDGSYVVNIDKDETHRALVQAINTVAQALGKKTIAEFVEDEKVLKVLEELGVDFGQGYYLGRPSLNL